MEQKLFYLYKITNTVNDKLYIGVTSNPKDREKAHFYGRSQTAKSLIKNAIDKYGVEIFRFEILVMGERDYIYDLERKAISSYQSISPTGYNIKPGGEGGRGHAVVSRSDDTPVYVSGFWFPSVRYATRATGLPRSTIHRRMKYGSAGDVIQKSNFRLVKGQPVFVGGFWFPCIEVAGVALVKRPGTLRKRIIEGFVDQKEKPKQRKGEESYLYGRKGADCVNSKPVEVEGVCYVSLTEAVKGSGYSEGKIRNRIKSNHPDFKFK